MPRRADADIHGKRGATYYWVMFWPNKKTRLYYESIMDARFFFFYNYNFSLIELLDLYREDR